MTVDLQEMTIDVSALDVGSDKVIIEVDKECSTRDLMECILRRLNLDPLEKYELVEVIRNVDGEVCKERCLDQIETPATLQLVWPAEKENQPTYRFCLRKQHEEWNPLRDLITEPLWRLFPTPIPELPYSDLCQLPELSEQALLSSLRHRFEAGCIYTYIGSILIAINPFRFFPIYNPKFVRLYQRRSLGELPPHIFAMADHAYQTMLKERSHQCIVISGESGSGKTESTNFLLHHLSAVSPKGTQGARIERVILAAAPILEAFGNAKTVHNNNSSRFGKFIQVNYRENGMICGAILHKYLLERFRVCGQSKEERNYHVFYYLLAGTGDKEKEILHLLDRRQYSYLNQNDLNPPEGVNENLEFRRLCESMTLVGFSPDTQWAIFSALSAILLLGNVRFEPRRVPLCHDESVTLTDRALVENIAGLLGLTSESMRNVLLARKAKTGSGEELIIRYRLADAQASRDALAKGLYAGIFDWIVLRLNAALRIKVGKALHAAKLFVGVLDIFGFEDFQHNGLEQLCINYANERLHAYFNDHVFRAEEQEYRTEGIRWERVSFTDNTSCLELLEGRPRGLLCVLDDQSQMPGTSYQTLLKRFGDLHRDHPNFLVPPRLEEAFIVRHYAGNVKYEMADFREKNLDLMRPDVLGILRTSSISLIRQLSGVNPKAAWQWAVLRAFFKSLSAFRNVNVSDSKLEDSHLHSRFVVLRYDALCDLCTRILPAYKNYSCLSAKKNWEAIATSADHVKSRYRTVTSQFQASLRSLLDILGSTKPMFVRCIKSNASKTALQWNESVIQRQLRYTGMLETVRIRRSGYPVRLTYEQFFCVYRILFSKCPHAEIKEKVHSVFKKVDINENEYQLGKTRIFLRSQCKIKLDSHLHNKLLDHIVTLQRWIRTRTEHRRFQKLRHLIVRFQAHARAYVIRQEVISLRTFHLAAVNIQKEWRAHRIRQWYLRLQNSILYFQASARGHLLRQKFSEMKKCHRLKQIASSENKLKKDFSALDQNLNHFQSVEDLSKNVDIENNHRDRNVMYEFNNTSSKTVSKPVVYGHQLERTVRPQRGDVCCVCQKVLPSIFGPAQQCRICFRLFHQRCLAHALTVPCKTDKLTQILHKKTEDYFEDINELSLLEEYLTQQISQLENSPDITDDSIVLCKTLHNLKFFILTTRSMMDFKLPMKQSDILNQFEYLLAAQKIDLHPENAVEILKKILSEFKQTSALSQDKKIIKNALLVKKHSQSSITGHNMYSQLAALPTACEVCGSWLWLLERAYVCRRCGLTCHKRCVSSAPLMCVLSLDSSKHINTPTEHIMGVQLEYLITPESLIPLPVCRLLKNIEKRGLYTEGLYRKSAPASLVRQLINHWNSHPDTDLNSYSVHALTTLLKSFLRALPEPVFTTRAYNDFLQASDVPNDGERLSAILALLKELPKTHYNLLERILFHLSLVALEEGYNRMSTNALSVIFAPCFMRPRHPQSAQDGLRDVTRQVTCVHTLLNAQLQRIQITLNKIDDLDIQLNNLLVHTQKHELRQKKQQLASTLSQLPRAPSEEDLSEAPQ